MIAKEDGYYELRCDNCGEEADSGLTASTRRLSTNVSLPRVRGGGPSRTRGMNGGTFARPARALKTSEKLGRADHAEAL
jgi:hypothetical protein